MGRKKEISGYDLNSGDKASLKKIGGSELIKIAKKKLGIAVRKSSNLTSENKNSKEENDVEMLSEEEEPDLTEAEREQRIREKKQKEEKLLKETVDNLTEEEITQAVKDGVINGSHFVDKDEQSTFDASGNWILKEDSA